jgi:inner membrane protein
MRRHGNRPLLRTAIWFSVLSLLPDIDVVGFAFGVPYGAPWGHRGATHSLAFAGAVGLSIAAAAFARMKVKGRGSNCLAHAMRLGAYSTIVVASHGIIDAMTNGGKGIALLWPVTTHRYFFSWRPIPVAPIGARFLTLRGARVAAIELIEFSVFFAYALWPRPKVTPFRRPPSR